MNKSVSGNYSPRITQIEKIGSKLSSAGLEKRKRRPPVNYTAGSHQDSLVGVYLNLPEEEKVHTLPEVGAALRTISAHGEAETDGVG